MRVVPDLRALLVAVERLDGHINVQHPRLAEQRLDARAQLARQPAQTLGFIDALERPAHHVLAHHVGHAQQRRIERVPAQRVDVRIAPVPAQNGQRCRAHHIARPAPAVAVIPQRTPLQQPRPAPAGVQELREENQLPLAGDRRIQIQLRVIAPARSVHRPRRRRQLRRRNRLTRWVSANHIRRQWHSPPRQLFPTYSSAFKSRF